MSLFLLYLLLAALWAKRCGTAALGGSLLLLTATSPTLLHLFSGAVSEGLFLPLALMATLLTVAFAIGRRPGLLLAAGAAGALAILTRYAGLSLVLSGPLIVVTLSRESWKRRLVDASGLALLSASPLVLWILIQRARYGAEAPRAFSALVSEVGPRLREFSVKTLATLWSMLPLTDGLPSVGHRVELAVIGCLALVLLISLVGLLWRRPRGTSLAEDLPIGTLWGMVVFAGAYLLGLGAASAATEPPPDIDPRILAPLLVPSWWIVLGLATLGLMRLRRARWLASLPLLATILLAWHQAPLAAESLARLHSDGEGYTSRAWRTSGLVIAVRGLPEDVALISNDTDALLFWCDRAAYDIPELATDQARQNLLPFGADANDPVERKFRDEGAALVLFDTIGSQLESLYGLKGALRLRILTDGLWLADRTGDGAIYFHAQPVTDGD